MLAMTRATVGAMDPAVACAAALAAASLVPALVEGLRTKNAAAPSTTVPAPSTVSVVRSLGAFVRPKAAYVPPTADSVGSDEGGVARAVADSPAARSTPEMRSSEMRERRGAKGSKSAASWPTDS